MWLQPASGKIILYFNWILQGSQCSLMFFLLFTWSVAPVPTFPWVYGLWSTWKKMLKTCWCGKWRPRGEEVRDTMPQQNHIRLVFVESQRLKKKNSLCNFLFYSSVWVLISGRVCPPTPGMALSSELLLCLGWGIGPRIHLLLPEFIEAGEGERIAWNHYYWAFSAGTLKWPLNLQSIKKPTSPHSKKPMFVNSSMASSTSWTFFLFIHLKIAP